MRRLIAVYSSLALLLALFMTPFQHVHFGIDDDHEGHHHSSVIHSHFLLVSVPVEASPGFHVTDVDPPHRGTSLDSFAIAIPATLTLLFRPESRVVVFAPVPYFGPVELVELRGHDPPSLDFSSPRAPPV